MFKLVVFTSSLYMASPAWAYIDPGSGMAFVSGIGAWLAAIGAFFIGAISLFFKRWVGFFKNLFSSSKKKDEKK